MKWFIVFLMIGSEVEGLTEYYQITDPTFETSQECVAYVATQSHILKDHIKMVYPLNRVKQVFCANEESFHQMLGTDKI